jgi:hypothetical protein
MNGPGKMQASIPYNTNGQITHRSQQDFSPASRRKNSSSTRAPRVCSTQQEEQMQEYPRPQEGTKPRGSNPVHGSKKQEAQPLTFQQRGAVQRGGSGQQEPQRQHCSSRKRRGEERRERGQDRTGQKAEEVEKPVSSASKVSQTKPGAAASMPSSGFHSADGGQASLSQPTSMPLPRRVIITRGAPPTNGVQSTLTMLSKALRTC